ncbi:hypothetical protein ES703_96674 [subsurface metagenome]
MQEPTEAEEPTEETDETPAEEAAVEPAPETTEPSPQKPANEIKVVIVLKDDKIMLGVQSPDCDPVYDTMEGTLAAALKKVPALVARAKKQWEANPRYPKAVLPEPPPSPTPARTTAASQPAKKPAQKPMF